MRNNSEAGPTPLSAEELRAYPPLVLAWVGDAVFDLMVRRHLIKSGMRRMNELHREAVSIVCAESQAAILHRFNQQGVLSEEEADIVRRGRNSATRAPRRATPQEYNHSTGFEALLGWLWLRGDEARLEQLIALALAPE
ncbi:MAG: ribonuclease III domain-containing protein [Syntrophomonadaceae bacterium]|nr:ribonuclease III domain-containing protein [Syntrophomonadaceae bacterium]